MSSGSRDQDPDGVDLAINRVLAAERGARDQAERCRQQAASILAAAEDESRRIARRAEHRIGLAHGIADAGAEAALRRMAEQTPVATGAEGGVDVLLDRITGTLADEIIGVET